MTEQNNLDRAREEHRAGQEALKDAARILALAERELAAAKAEWRREVLAGMRS